MGIVDGKVFGMGYFVSCLRSDCRLFDMSNKSYKCQYRVKTLVSKRSEQRMYQCGLAAEE